VYCYVSYIQTFLLVKETFHILMTFKNFVALSSKCHLNTKHTEINLEFLRF